MVKSLPVVTLTGHRQSGKTILVRHLFPDYEYINLENLNDFHAVQEDPIRFLKIHLSTGVIIDEIQKLPELFSKVHKTMRRKNRTADQFFEHWQRNRHKL